MFRSRCACLVLTSVQELVGGCGGTGWWCLRLQLCLPAVPGLWAVPRISENKNELMTIPLTPSEGEGSVSLVSDIPSSKQSSGSDQRNVHKGHFLLPFWQKNSRLFSK